MKYLQILNCLINRPVFSEKFQAEIVSKISRKRRYDDLRNKTLLKIPPADELKLRFESRFENGNLK